MKRTSLIILVLLLTLTSTYCHTYIVCVGVADYPGTKNDLLLSATDAETMSELYRKNGNATVCLFQNEQATVANVSATLSQLCRQATADDDVVFYFSGHGLSRTFLCYDALLRYDDVINTLGSSPAKTKIIYADACFSGKARRSDKRATADDYAQSCVLLFLSSRTNERSFENWLMCNSLFTAYLERGLRGGADTNLDRIITAQELFTFVSEGVQQKSRGKQHPVMWGRFHDDMPVMTW